MRHASRSRRSMTIDEVSKVDTTGLRGGGMAQCLLKDARAALLPAPPLNPPLNMTILKKLPQIFDLGPVLRHWCDVIHQMAP